jgi:succinate dehydrogenase flavin-adding protein (antitoxin of CptAB toxin-antitoxin module)
MMDFTNKITPRENYLRHLKGENPQYICSVEHYTGRPMFDRAFGFHGTQAPGEFKDNWGVTWVLEPGQPAAVPMTTEANKVIKDITKWDKYLNVPWPSKMTIDWAPHEAQAQAHDRKNTLLYLSMPRGLFEMTHALMTFEDALCAFLEEPEAMCELLDVLMEFKLECLKLICDHVKPDIIQIHDDWGNKKSLFMNPTTWRETLKPRWAKIYAYMHERGVIVQHHADCICEPITPDMAEIGVDVWQGVIPQNNIAWIQKEVGLKMAMQGGIDSAVIEDGTSNLNEAAIRKEVRRCIDDYSAIGNFIPAHPNHPLNKAAIPIISDEFDTYGEHYFDRLKAGK